MDQCLRAGRQFLNQCFDMEQRLGKEGTGKEKDKEKQNKGRGVAQQVDIQAHGQGCQTPDMGIEHPDQGTGNQRQCQTPQPQADGHEQACNQHAPVEAFFISVPEIGAQAAPFPAFAGDFPGAEKEKDKQGQRRREEKNISPCQGGASSSQVICRADSS